LLGRKPTLSIYMSLMAFLSAIGIALSLIEGMDLAVTILYVIIRGIANSCICIHLCYVSEVFPTSIRQMTLGLIHAIAGGVSIAASFTGKPAKDVWEPLPLAIYGGMAFISALLVLVLPETLGESLPDTVDDTCNLGKNRPPVDSFDHSNKGGETKSIVDKNVLINNHVHTVSKAVDIENNYKTIEPVLRALRHDSEEYASWTRVSLWVIQYPIIVN